MALRLGMVNACTGVPWASSFWTGTNRSMSSAPSASAQDGVPDPRCLLPVVVLVDEVAVEELPQVLDVGLVVVVVPLVGVVHA
jgi:hypothetical protein